MPSESYKTPAQVPPDTPVKDAHWADKAQPSYHPMPVLGYTKQSHEIVNLVNQIKIHEEKILRSIDQLKVDATIDQRWLAIAKTQLEQGYMSLVRSIFKPERLEVLPETDD